MSPWGVWNAKNRADFPRVSGDEPLVRWIDPLLDRFSPRERG